MSVAASTTGLRRRRLLGLAATAPVVAGCANLVRPPERLVEVASGRALTRAELLAAMRASDFVLLGELHDNALHHARRGALLADLAALGGPPPAIVAEHLTRGRRAQFAGDLKAGLAAAGFDARGWQWPVHEPLFAAVAGAGLPLLGGNVEPALARRVAREARTAVPPDLLAVIDGAPLPPAAQAALDADLVDGHCGRLPPSRLEGMRWSQRTRDASMWLALREAGTHPAILLAGNGHVRTDFGVAQIAARLQPAARILSVGFLEADEEVAGAPYTHVWITAKATREDPCAHMPTIAPAAPPPPASPAASTPRP